jgi:LmbE family N-acetylglucosaminyl deacetylase
MSQPSSRVDAGPVLVVAAHGDDEVLGCGGTMARFSAEGRPVHLLLLADGESSRARVAHDPVEALTDARLAAARRSAEILGCASVSAHSLPDNRMDSCDLLDVVQLIEASIEACAPTLVLAHFGNDVNIDHRVTHEAVQAACRPQPGSPVRVLWFFEVASSTEWRTPGGVTGFAPNVFVDITGQWPKKVDALHAYAKELRPFPHARSVEGVEALARWRGVTIGVPYAEAFVAGRTIL